jgi:hypothetical protein
MWITALSPKVGVPDMSVARHLAEDSPLREKAPRERGFC